MVPFTRRRLEGSWNNGTDWGCGLIFFHGESGYCGYGDVKPTNGVTTGDLKYEPWSVDET